MVQKRFGARYGRTVKKRWAEVMRQQLKLYKCPVCKRERLKRSSTGIWQCKKCGAKLAGKAYSVS